MRRRHLASGLVVAAALLTGMASSVQREEVPGKARGPNIALPPPSEEGPLSLEETLRQRRSVRDYHPSPLKLSEISQLLWAAQGVNRTGGHRTAPSAGALYPLEVYLAVGDVQGLEPGVYRYLPVPHALGPLAPGDRRDALRAGALGQACVGDGAAVLVIGAVYARTERKYGKRGVRYVHIEVGAAAQNVYLQASALGLGTVFIGAFDDREVRKALSLPPSVAPLAVMPVGRSTEEVQTMTLTITSEAFTQGGEIPERYTCDGEDLSPPLAWSGIPEGTKSLCLIVDDPDAPDPEAPRRTWVHWVLYNLPPDTAELPEGLAPGDLPPGTLEGVNDWNRRGYGGPCPPVGRHRYFFKLYALDTVLPDLHGPRKAGLEKAMQGHVLAEGELVGMYRH